MLSVEAPSFVVLPLKLNVELSMRALLCGGGGGAGSGFSGSKVRSAEGWITEGAAPFQRRCRANAQWTSLRGRGLAGAPARTLSGRCCGCCRAAEGGHDRKNQFTHLERAPLRGSDGVADECSSAEIATAEVQEGHPVCATPGQDRPSDHDSLRFLLSSTNPLDPFRITSRWSFLW